MVLVDKITIPELTGKKKKRRTYVYLPDSYEFDEEQRYPVLYMFDGHNVFFDEHATYGKCWGMLEYLEESGAEVIVVAVECNTNPDNGRLREYSPYSFYEKNVGKVIGQGKVTMEWWVNTLKPMVDSEFRTLPGRETTFIAGSSMGGLMSLYALLEYNEYFGGAAALSPSIWTNPRKILGLIKNSRLDPNTVLYLDYGSEEFGNHNKMKSLFAKTVSELIAKGVMVEARVVPGGSHCEACWEKQIPYFMDSLFYSLYTGSEE